jgi:ParB-like nuclease domain
MKRIQILSFKKVAHLSHFEKNMLSLRSKPVYLAVIGRASLCSVTAPKCHAQSGSKPNAFRHLSDTAYQISEDSMTDEKVWSANTVALWPIDKLTPHPENARTHDAGQVAKLADSIREYGWTIPVLADENGCILAGHGRVLAAKFLGMAQAPVIVAEGWSDEKKRRYAFADNRLAELSVWDQAILSLNQEMDLDGDYTINLSEPEIDDVELLANVTPEETEWSKASTNRNSAALMNDRNATLSFGKRRIPVNKEELDWLCQQMERHLKDYGMAMGFVEQTLKASSPGKVDEVYEGESENDGNGEIDAEDEGEDDLEPNDSAS